MKINFYPDSDGAELEKATKEYQDIWDKEGLKIISSIEIISGLKFKKKYINAIVYKESYGWSYPLGLSSMYDRNQKKVGLIHELCHRLFMDNKIETTKNTYIQVHKLIDLILFDIWSKLYGEKFAKEQVNKEIKIYGNNSKNPYKKAWDWALKMTSEERKREFAKYKRQNRG